jgi:hypothetical protein
LGTMAAGPTARPDNATFQGIKRGKSRTSFSGSFSKRQNKCGCVGHDARNQQAPRDRQHLAHLNTSSNGHGGSNQPYSANLSTNINLSMITKLCRCIRIACVVLRMCSVDNQPQWRAAECGLMPTQLICGRFDTPRGIKMQQRASNATTLSDVTCARLETRLHG